jgi:hypothetical protein
MTDQGGNHPPPGDPGQWGQQQPPQQPDYGQQPPAPPLYPTEPYGQPAYGQPAYGQPAYGAPGGPGGPAGPGLPVPAGGGGNRKGLLFGGVAVVVVAAAVLAYFLLSGSSASASTPKDAVKNLLNAGKAGDLNKAKKALCKSDIAFGAAGQLDTSERIASYSIGKQSTVGGVTVVEATFTTSKDSSPDTEKFPVVKEGKSWKVCFSRTPALLPSGLPSETASAGTQPPDIGLPTDLPSDLPTSLPGGQSLCASFTSGYEVASAYVGAAEVGITDVAQSCVYQHRVPKSVTEGLKGKLFAPDTTSETPTAIVFKSTDGSTTLTVTTSRQSDGHFYVTDVKTD